MAELTITIPACDPDEPKLTLQFDRPTPIPKFVEIEDADGTVHRYVPAEAARQRDLLLEVVKKHLRACGDEMKALTPKTAPRRRALALKRELDAAIAECEDE